jgi:CheY-like chemotaxis protein
MQPTPRNSVASPPRCAAPPERAAGGRRLHQRAAPSARRIDADTSALAHDGSVKSPAPTTPDIVDRHGRVVILVEDDTGLRCALERLLRASGFNAKAFASAEEALATFHLEKVDCLVVDLNLPAMSGFDLIDRLRERHIEVPAVVISAQDEPRVRTAARAHGASHFLPKPFLGSALIRALDSFCRR